MRTMDDTALERACDTANRSEDVHSIEQEFDALSTDIDEPWTNATSR